MADLQGFGAESKTAESPAPSPDQIAVDLRSQFEKLGLSVRRQGGRPTCSVFTVAGAIEFAAAKHTNGVPRLSVEFLNWAANQACGDRADGGFFSDLWRGFTNSGICTESLMPYQAKFSADAQPNAAASEDARTRLSLGLQLHWIKPWDVQTGLTPQHLAEIKSTLKRGWPVCAGLRWPKNQKWINGVLQMCPPEAVYDGHSVLLVGFRENPSKPGSGFFIFRNTSGGNHGEMPFEYAAAYMNDAAWIE